MRGRFTENACKKQSWKSQLFKVSNKRKPSRIFSLVYKLLSTTSNSSEFCRKKYLQTKWIIRPLKLGQKSK